MLFGGNSRNKTPRQSCLLCSENFVKILYNGGGIIDTLRKKPKFNPSCVRNLHQKSEDLIKKGLLALTFKTWKDNTNGNFYSLLLAKYNHEKYTSLYIRHKETVKTRVKNTINR